MIEGSGDTLGSESERSADDDDYESDFVVADEETGLSSYVGTTRMMTALWS